MDSPLKSQLAEAIQQRRYAQAQELYESLNQEALHSRFAKLQQLKFKQTQANSSIEQNLKQNLEDFHAHWAAVFENFQQACEDEKEALLAQHAEDLELAQAQRVQVPVRPTKELLNYIRCRDQAVRSNRFKDAEAMQQAIDAEQSRALRQFRRQREHKLKAQLDKLNKAFELKRNRLELRQKEARDELNLQRRKELQRVHLKAHNIRNTLKTAGVRRPRQRTPHS